MNSIQKHPIFCYGAMKLDTTGFFSPTIGFVDIEGLEIKDACWIVPYAEFRYIDEAYRYGTKLCNRYNHFYSLLPYGVNYI